MKYTIALFFTFLAFLASSQEYYKIEVKLKDYKGSNLFLANYSGDKTYLVDTSQTQGNGHFVFEKEKFLKGGVYIVVSHDKKSMFEFLVSDSRQMKLETEGPDYIGNMTVSNSKENKLFMDYLQFGGSLFKRAKPLNEKLGKLSENSDSIPIIKEQITTINNELNTYRNRLIKEYPDTFLASFLQLLNKPVVPEVIPTLPDGKKDSTYAYRYYKSHFWDGINFMDDRIVRTPIYAKKLDSYFDQVVIKDTDTIISEIDKILQKMDEKGDLYKFSLWHLTVKFDQSQIMGHDAVMVHLSDNYFSKGKASWLDNQTVKNIITEADKRRASLIGEIAPNLTMQDTTFKPRSLHDVKSKYTVLYFWDPGCGHCSEETPELVKFYKENSKKLDVEIFAVCTDTSMVEMKKYINEKNMTFINVNGPRTYTKDYHDLYNVISTPLIVVIDEDKKIIAKKLASSQLAKFIQDYNALIRRKKKTAN